MVSGLIDSGGNKEELTFLSVAGEDPLAFSGNDVPDPHVGVITPRYKCSSPSSESAHRMLMPFQMKFVVWVLVHVLLCEYDVRLCGSTPVRIHPYLCGIDLVLTIPETSVLAFIWSREQPDAESMITTTGHNHRSLRPLFPTDHAIISRCFDPLRFDNGEAADGACVATEDVGTTAGVEIPDTNGAICRTTDEDVLGCG